MTNIASENKKPSLPSKTEDIVQYDYDTMRIMCLAVPSTCNTMVLMIGDLVILVLVSQYLGTVPMITYSMTGELAEFLVVVKDIFNQGLPSGRNAATRPGYFFFRALLFQMCNLMC